MSDRAREARKKQIQAYFNYAPDSMEISVLSGKGGTEVSTFNGFFLAPYVLEGARRQGTNHTRKRAYQIQAYTDDILSFDRDTYLKVEGIEYRVTDNQPDKSPGSYQGTLWLSKVVT